LNEYKNPGVGPLEKFDNIVMRRKKKEVKLGNDEIWRWEGPLGGWISLKCQQITNVQT